MRARNRKKAKESAERTRVGRVVLDGRDILFVGGRVRVKEEKLNVALFNKSDKVERGAGAGPRRLLCHVIISHTRAL